MERGYYCPPHSLPGTAAPPYGGSVVKNMPTVEDQVLALAPLIRKQFSANSFQAYYELIADRSPPAHVLDEWTPRFFENKESSTPTMLWAARGLTKSTTAIMLTTYCLGFFPAGSILYVTADDKAAADVARAIMATFANPKYNIVFPHVEPDKPWGVEAMWVKDTSVPYEVWAQQRGDVMNPSIRCVGYKSRIRGAHPATLVIIDDIHNDDNAFSDRELSRVKTFMGAELQHTLQPNYPWEIVIGTPFHEDDVYSTLVNTGKYDHIVTPGARDEYGDPAWPGEPVWPGGLPADKIQLKLDLDETGGVVFRREVLCDITASDGREMPFTDFPKDDISPDWSTYGGYDFATVPEPGARMRHRSHAATAWVAKTPNAQLVLTGGEIGQWTQGQVEDAIVRTQNRHRNFLFGAFDAQGKGEIFLENLQQRRPELYIIPAPASTKKKAQRYFDDLAPLLRDASVMISDNDDWELLRLVRGFLRRYPNVPHQSAKAWDAMDAFYMAVMAAKGEIGRKRKKKRKHPFAYFGSKYD